MNPLLLYLLFNPKYYIEYYLSLFSNQDYSQLSQLSQLSQHKQK